MCGIVSILGCEDKDLTNEIMNRLVHRGPDAQGTFFSDNASLGHRRLSIMDPAGGNQPIISENKKRAIVANGEIYNFPKLYKQLSKTHSVSTTSDSEIVLHLYEDIALDTAFKLDGMFAFVILNGNQFYVARDTVGIKPLYYGYSGERMVFASELKALAGLARNVKEFPPGTYYSSENGFKKYRSIPNLKVEDLPEEYWCKSVRSTLEKSVIKRLMSDVPVGAFLSGGLDSSVIAAIMNQHVKELHTFSVGLAGSSDILAARLVAKYLGTIHHEYILSKDDIIRYLPEIIFHLESFDQDLVRSAVPCFFVSRLAADYVKVILTGEGADELFGGYTYHKDINQDEVLHEELYRSVSSLHNINLQRVDRLTMAHSIEGRVPFLDLDMIELGQRIPVKWKIRKDKNKKQIEKWILRKACEDLLPKKIIWRDKEQFDEGSGTADNLKNLVTKFMNKKQALKYLSVNSQAKLRSLEEGVYHKLLIDAYEDPSVVLANVARWGENRFFRKFV